MLSALSIRNIVLIDRLDIEFGPALTVLTGETGAGKSILLDAFALALGARGDAQLVRHGTKEGHVTALFNLSPDHPVHQLLLENAISGEETGTLILRRHQSADGRAKAFINDAPVSVQLLACIGEKLVEIHGQHDDRALTDTECHRDLLDAYGGLGEACQVTEKNWQEWQSATQALVTHQALLEKHRETADYLHHALEELILLDTQEGEEKSLTERRHIMMHAEKIIVDLEAVDKTLSSDQSGQANLSAIMRKLERRNDESRAITDPVMKALEAVLIEIDEARHIVQSALRELIHEPAELEEVETRLFALRAAARKHKVQVDHLPELKLKLEKDLSALQSGEEKLTALQNKVAESYESYSQAARHLSDLRRKWAQKLDQAVKKELPPLKLEKARFLTHIETVDLSDGGPNGIDRITFWVQTNPGTEAGPMMKIASGGELSRFILALKVVLAARGSAPVLIFDEIDSGVGGAVSSAIGERLSKLAQNVQVLAITHAPQVAALSQAHLHISKQGVKNEDGETMVTKVVALDDHRRCEEIARMLAGTTVTDEARAAAKRLIGGAS